MRLPNVVPVLLATLVAGACATDEVSDSDPESREDDLVVDKLSLPPVDEPAAGDTPVVFDDDGAAELVDPSDPAEADSSELGGDIEAVADADIDDADIVDRDAAAAKGGFIGRYSSPSIVRVGDVDHAYFAKQSIRLDNKVRSFRTPHATFSNGRWSEPHEVLPHLGKGAKANGPVWAPSVAKIDANRWMLFYTAQIDRAGSQKKCLWRAHATSPEGPFVDDFAGPLYCAPGSLWAIDAYAVEDARGRWHLAARIDLGNGINSIQIRRLTDDGRHFAAGSTWHVLARNHQDSWDQHVMENAGVVRLAPPDGKPAHWFVFYSAKHWEDNTYSIGYVDCGENIDGSDQQGCVKKTPRHAWLQTHAASHLFGPGTPTFYTNGGGDELMSIQAWRYSGGVAKGPNQAKNRAQGQIMKTYAIVIDNAYRPHVALRRTDL